MVCLGEKLEAVRNGPFPPVPAYVPKPPRYDNRVTPRPSATPNRRAAGPVHRRR